MHSVNSQQVEKETDSSIQKEQDLQKEVSDKTKT